MASAKQMRSRVGALLVVAALAVAGCGGGGAGSRTSTGTSVASESASSSASASAGAASMTTSTTSSAPRRRRHHRAHLHGAPIGTTRRVNAGVTTVAVTVTHVFDPLRGSGAALLPGTRAVGVMVTIADDGSATYDSTASGDWSVISSAGNGSPLFVRQGVCQTQDVDFESLIGPGQARSGCVAFSVPRRAKLLAVRFSPHSRAPGSVTWR